MSELSYSLALRVLKYEAETGCLYWRERPAEMFSTPEAAHLWNSRYAGEMAFTHVDKDGYKVGTLFGKSYKAHRLIWLMETGAWPKWRIDHLDGNRANNRIPNLRDVRWGVNCRNRSMGSKNTSGVVGVRWDPQSSKWQAYIKVERKLVQLGKFTEKNAAIEARQTAVRRFDFTERHGMPSRV